VILADSSAWVEYLRDTGSAVSERMRALVVPVGRLAVTEPVVMEILAGARNDAEWSTLRRLLYRCELVPLAGLEDFEAAARVYRVCRGAGQSVRRLPDCLIAAVAIRAGLDVLHRDRDFEAIARHTDLRVVAA